MNESITRAAGQIPASIYLYILCTLPGRCTMEMLRRPCRA